MKFDKLIPISIAHDGSAGLCEVADTLCKSLEEMGYRVAAEASERNVKIEISVCRPFTSCLMTADGDTVAICCGGAFSASVAAERLAELLKESDELADGVLYEMHPDAPNARTQGTDTRIMTSNILAHRWTNTTAYGRIRPVEQRVEIYAATLASSAPDAVGVQETDAKWISVLPTYLERLADEYGVEYEWLFYDYDNRQTLTTVLYRRDRLELTDSGIDSFSVWKKPEYYNRGYHLRLVEWALLRDRTGTDSSFIIVNTHWGADFPSEIAEEIALVNELRAKYGVPVFCTGDFNRRETTEEHAYFIKSIGGASTREQAALAGTLANVTGGIGKMGEPRDAGTFYIDHIFGVGEYSVLKYETLQGHNNYLSDHSPHIADIKF